MPLETSSFPHVMNSLNGPTAPKYTYLVFYSSVINGQMWCPDCRNVESVVKKMFDGESKPRAIVYWVGNREDKCKARVDWNVQSVPTILRIENGKETARIVDRDILDSSKVEAFMKTE